MTAYTPFHIKSCTSTMDEASRLFQEGRVHFIVTTDAQTQGRGRRGRVWDMPAGNLALSIGTTLSNPISTLSDLSFVAALSLGETLLSLCPEVPLTYKWPNDIMLGGKKAGGILVEAHTQQNKTLVTIGMGLNLRAAPPNLPYEATSLYEVTEKKITPPSFIHPLLCLFDTYKDLWLKEGLSPIIEKWRQRAFKLGEEICLTTDSRAIRGLFKGLDDRGRIQIEPSFGEGVTLSTGDIVKGH